MRARRGGMTLAEYTVLLKADPEWMARQQASERKRENAERTLREEQAPLLDALRTIGINVKTVWNVVDTVASHPLAFPILLDHLHRPYSDRIREGIARALGTKEARDIAWDQLIELLRGEAPESGAKDGMMAAISAMTRPSDLQTLIDLINDQSIGPCRIFLVRNLVRSRKLQARQALLDLRDDPDLTREINARLKRSTS